jgi:hypothetical protein
VIVLLRGIQKQLGAAFDNKVKNPWILGPKGIIMAITDPSYWKDDEWKKILKNAGKKMDLIPGDLRSFYNPNYKVGYSAYEFETAIYLGNGDYFAHPFGIRKGAQIMDELKKMSTSPETVRDLGISRRPIIPSAQR